MKRTEVTYGQLDAVLRSLGFSRRLYAADPPPTLVCSHEESGARILLPPFPETDYVLEYHLVTVRVTLDSFGIAEPSLFDSELQRAG